MQTTRTAKKSPKFDRFIETLRADATKKSYTFIIHSTVGEPDAFLSLAQKDRAKAEEFLIDWILNSKGKIAGSSIYTRLSAVRSFLDFNEADLNWSRLRKVAPVAVHVGKDRAPTLSEIRKLLSFCGVRDRVIVLIMASSGIRVGAFQWAVHDKRGEIDYLRISDATRLEDGCYWLKVYRGEPEEYDTLISPEAGAALDEYLESRRRIAEVLTPDSPLIRDKWNYEVGELEPRETPQKRIADPRIAVPMKSLAVKALVRRLWIKAGLKVQGEKNDFKMNHGFRKFFKTQATKGVNKELSVEVLMGHKLNYFKPTPEELLEEYMKAVPFLTVGESFALKQELEAQGTKHESDWTRTRLELLEVKEKNAKLEKALETVLPLIDQIKAERQAEKRAAGGP